MLFGTYNILISAFWPPVQLILILRQEVAAEGGVEALAIDLLCWIEPYNVHSIKWEQRNTTNCHTGRPRRIKG